MLRRVRNGNLHALWRWGAGATRGSSPGPATLVRHAATSTVSDGPSFDRDVLRTSVAIVGGGPTGVTLSLLLSSFGVPNVVVERKTRLTDHPQAHFINTRTMEVFRQLGGLADGVRRKSPPLREWSNFRYCESVLGHTFGEIDHFEDYAAGPNASLSPSEVVHLSQNRLLPMMMRELEASPHSRFLAGREFVSLEQVEGGVRLGTSDGLGGSGAIEAAYVVGCDGARSPVRGAAGIGMQGDPNMQSIMNIHFESPALARALKSEGREAMLYFVYNPKVVGVIVAHSIDDGDFVAQIPFFPPLEKAEAYTADRCQAILANAIGRDVGATVLGVRPWNMSALVADTFRSGRVFLAGDAAHLFPPAGGFGMNTGIQDAHNLAWRLAYALGGSARPSILDGYSRERRKVAVKNTCLSVANFDETVKVARAFGLDPGLAKGLMGALLPASGIPGLRQPTETLAESILSLGKLQTSPWSPLRPLQRLYLDGLLTQERSLRLLYPEEDIGFCYEDPDIDIGGGDFRGWSKTRRRTKFSPRVKVGSRFPHLQVSWWRRETGPPCVYSTIDLVAEHKRSFLILVPGSSGRAGEVRDTLASLHEEVSFAVTTAFVNFGADSVDPRPGELFVEADWSKLEFDVGIEADKVLAVVVRPDGHVAAILKDPFRLTPYEVRTKLTDIGLAPTNTKRRSVSTAS